MTNVALDVTNMILLLVLIGVLFYLYIIYTEFKNSVTKLKGDYDKAKAEAT